MPESARTWPRHLPWLVAILMSTVARGARPAAAQERAAYSPFLPGLVARYADAKGHTAVRVDPQLGFQWGEAPPDPRLVAGDFRATWQGRLLVHARGEYRFALFGSGE